MNYLAVEFHCRTLSEAHFPLYTGSMLRGALGNSLRSAVCVRKEVDCPDCMLAQSCIFPKLFISHQAPAESLGAPRTAPPFCIEPPSFENGELPRDTHFTFTLKLFSYAVEYLPYFVHAWTIAGKRGLGRDTHKGCGQYVIEDILHNGISVYDASQERLTTPSPEDLPTPTLLDASEDTSVCLELHTPLRCKQDNHLATSLTFPFLLRLIIRRLSSLYALDGLAFRLPEDVLAATRSTAERMLIQDSALRWHDWRRYSGRQNTLMQLGGLVGRISYVGPAAAFAEYLAFAAKAHLGKQTSFGLGAISVVDDAKELNA